MAKMGFLTPIIVLYCLVATSYGFPQPRINSPGEINSDMVIDGILAELWKVGDRWQYTTLSAIKETECDNLKQKLSQIQNFFKQKYSSNQLVIKSVEILINGKEKYQKEEVCSLIEDKLSGDLLLSQAMEINDYLKHTRPLRKNFTIALSSAAQPAKPYDLSQILCLTKLWAQQTVEKSSKFFKTQQRIKKWFELNIEPIIVLFESSGHKSAQSCDLRIKNDHAQVIKHKSLEFTLLETLNYLTDKLA